MRLTADILLSAPVYVNALGQRELCVRALKIPAIENLGAGLDAFDAIDFSDNEIGKLDNFPIMRRLCSLMLSNNMISRVDASIGRNLPNLDTLVLTNNRISNLADIHRLASLSSLTLLSLLHNPVTRRAHYRFYTIFKFPRLRTLDFQKVKRKERVAAIKFFTSKAGQAVLADIEKQVAEPSGPTLAAASTSAGGSATAAPSASAAAGRPTFTAEQLNAIRAAIAAAKSAEEVDRLEKALREGILPPDLIPGASNPAVASILASAPVPMTAH